MNRGIAAGYGRRHFRRGVPALFFDGIMEQKQLVRTKD